MDYLSQLTPEQLAQLRGGNPLTLNGWRYYADNQGGGKTDGGDPLPYLYGATSYLGQGMAPNGTLNASYDGSGHATGTYNVKSMADYDNALMAAMAATLGGMTMFGPNGLMAGGAGSGAAGAANGMWDVLPEAVGGAPATSTMGAAAGGGSGAFLGEGAASGIPAWDAAAGAGTAAGGAGAATAKGLLSGAGSLLGPAATVLGALAGSQPQTKSQTTQQELPDYLKPYVTAPGGLLDSANSLMKQQMAYVPQQGQQIANMGLGLLQQPIAGNGFQMFMQKPRFGG